MLIDWLKRKKTKLDCKVANSITFNDKNTEIKNRRDRFIIEMNVFVSKLKEEAEILKRLGVIFFLIFFF